MLEQSTILDDTINSEDAAILDESAILNSDYSEDDYSFMLTNWFIKNRSNKPKLTTEKAIASENTSTEKVIETSTEEVIKIENLSTEQVNEELTTAKDIIEETTIENMESTSNSINEKESNNDNEQSVTTENNEDTTLDISLAFKVNINRISSSFYLRWWVSILILTGS